ncbi:hypothetical protein H0H81_003795 [Sphagnurus paluster]|uniref:Uncharacterized protein n=1 Tax=Sphagnurus paluster TaxID=117069 RepID=A0A9P7GXG9_9AGAR|nr:hypothetical protein H0H81_003795 [Sphagnurus paluster]
MNALSRREEDTLLKTTKARALQECDAVVKALARSQWRRFAQSIFVYATRNTKNSFEPRKRL